VAARRGGDERQAVAVVGGGIAGLSVARELAARGLEVSVYEARRVGAGSSGAAVGVLSAPGAGRSAFSRLCREGYEMYPELAAELRAETGIDVGYRECGSVRLVGALPEDPEGEIERWREAGVPARWVGRKALDALIPGLGKRFERGLEIDREAVVHPARLVEALAASCRKRGVEILEKRSGLKLFASGREARIRIPAEPESAASGRPAPAPISGVTVVLAAGCWSAEAAAKLPGKKLPVAPVRGQAIEMLYPSPKRVVRFNAGPEGKEYFIVPRGKECFWVGSTVEEVGFDESTTHAGQEELFLAAGEVLPLLRDDMVLRVWSGLRPKALRPGGPFLGRWPGLRNLWVSTGHYRSGILLAPISARLLAEAMLEGKNIPTSFALHH
jgi:glycine oxidase